MRARLSSLLMVIMMAGVAHALDGSPYLPGDPISAARVFENKGCIKCHVVDFGRQAVGPDLGRIHLSNNLYDIVGLMWNRAPKMAREMELQGVDFPQMDANDMVDLLAFIGVYQNYLLNYSREIDVQEGQRLFVEKRCENCHSFEPTSTANTVGPSLRRFRSATSPLSVLRAMWLHSYYMRKAGARMGIDWPVFSQGEIRGLLYYIISGDIEEPGLHQYLKPGSPKAGLERVREYRCLECHSVKGDGQRKAPDLAEILQGRRRDVYMVLEALWNHSPIMWKTFKDMKEPVPAITTNDLSDIIAYVYFSNFDQPTEATKPGLELFVTKQCNRCHEPTLGFDAGSPDKMEVVTNLWNHIPEMLTASEDEGVEWPTFTLGELSSLVEYLVHPSDSTAVAP